MRKIIWLCGAAAILLCAGCGLGERVPAEMASMDQSRPITNESSLEADVHLDIGALEIQSESAPKLYSVDLEYDKAGYQPEINYDAGKEGRLDVRLKSTHHGGVRNESQTNRLQLKLAESLPVSLVVNTGVGDARLSLSHLHLSRLDLESGVGGTRVTAYEPNPSVCEEIRLHSGVGSLDAVGLGNLNFRQLNFLGGVGSANLDFSGEWKQDADIRIEVGVGGVNMRMPRDVGVRVTAEKHFLSGLQLEGFHRESGDDYYSEKYGEKKVRVSIIVKTGIGGFRITWI